MSHYYDKKQSSDLNEQEITVRIHATEFPFVTASGLFSKDHLDFATKLLIETLDKELSSDANSQARNIVDLGCGWGVVAVTLKRLHPKLNFIACDINERAVVYTKKNAKKNKVDIDVLNSNILESLQSPVDIIVTNPPYAAGREVCYQFIEQSQSKLANNGKLYLVARHNKGGKTLSEHMEKTFGNVDTLAKQGGFRVYCSKK